jgi:hypothetical protein
VHCDRDRRVTCNTCGQVRPACKASAAVAAGAEPPDRCTTQDTAQDSQASHWAAASAASEESPTNDSVATKTFHTRPHEQHAAAAIISQPGFVDFAALSRRIFGTDGSASGAVPQSDSCTYEAAPTACRDAVSQPSAVPAAQVTAQTLSDRPDVPVQHQDSRIYEVAPALPKGQEARTASIDRKHCKRHVTANDAHAGLPSEASKQQPASTRHGQAGASAQPLVVVNVPRRRQQHGAAADGEFAQRTVPSTYAADYHQQMPTSDDEHSGNATDGDRTTDSDADLRRRHWAAERHRSWQQCASTAVGYG